MSRQGSARPPRTAEDALSLRLRGGPEAASAARGALARLRGDIDPATMENVRLLVTELVTNSVRHADARQVAVKAIVTGPSVWVEVTDEGPGFTPEGRRGRGDDDGGWGLFLVERLADRWAVERDGEVTSVWFELRRAE